MADLSSVSEDEHEDFKGTNSKTVRTRPIGGEPWKPAHKLHISEKNHEVERPNAGIDQISQSGEGFLFEESGDDSA